MIRRQDSHKKKKLGTKWRRPRGWQNKVRLNKKSYVKQPRIGERTPLAERDKHNGKLIVRVQNLPELQQAKDKAVVLAKIGMKKEIMLIEEGLKQNTHFTFDAKARLQQLKNAYDNRKQEKETAEQEKLEKKKAAEKKVEAAKKGEELEADKDQQKKAMDKELIKRQ